MKRLGKLKLNALNKAFLDEKELNLVRGGMVTCTCGCLYTDEGGLSSADSNSNNRTGYVPSAGYDYPSACHCACSFVGDHSDDSSDTGQQTYS